MGEPDGRYHIQIAEIFTSLQGEGLWQGELTTFIRTAGCNLRCRWCDTETAQSGGRPFTLKSIVDRVRSEKTERVCVTGGEPLHQPGISGLFKALKELPIRLSVETNGTFCLNGFNEVDSFSVDFKLPGSGEAGSFHADNWNCLRPRDELRFVIDDRTDYETAKEMISGRDISATVFFSPVFDGPEKSLTQSGRDLATWIIEDRLQVRYSLQLHKILGLK